LAAVHDFLPKHNSEHDGLILCDGADPNRAVVDDEVDGDEGGEDTGAYVVGVVEPGMEGPGVEGQGVEGRQGPDTSVPMTVAAPVPPVEVAHAVLPQVATAEAVIDAMPLSMVAADGQSPALRARVAALAAVHKAQMAALLADPDDDDGLL